MKDKRWVSHTIDKVCQAGNSMKTGYQIEEAQKLGLSTSVSRILFESNLSMGAAAITTKEAINKAGASFSPPYPLGDEPCSALCHEA